MKLVKNWKQIALKSHSMWAVYFGILLFVGAELLYLILGYQVINPFLVGYGGIFLLIYGGLGRLWDQGLSR